MREFLAMLSEPLNDETMPVWWRAVVGFAYVCLAAIPLAFIVIVLAALFAGRVESAQAHPLPKGTNVTIGLHQICKTVLICRDKAPQPKINCWWGNRGMTEEIYDPKLDALVTWRCQCPWGEYGRCFWTRVSFRPVPPEWMLPPNSHHVWDWQRRCASLVCLGFRVDHFYRSLRYHPNRLDGLS